MLHKICIEKGDRISRKLNLSYDKNNNTSKSPEELRERTLNMKEGEPEDFTNFSKKFRSPGDHRPKYFMAQ